MSSPHTNWLFVPSTATRPTGCWQPISPCVCNVSATAYYWPCEWEELGSAFRYAGECWEISPHRVAAIPPGGVELPTQSVEWISSCAVCCEEPCAEPCTGTACGEVCLDFSITLTYRFFCDPCPDCNDCLEMSEVVIVCSDATCETIFGQQVVVWDCGSGITVTLNLDTGTWATTGIPADPYSGVINCNCADPCGTNELCGCATPIPNPCNARTCRDVNNCTEMIVYRCCKFADGRCDIAIQIERGDL